MKQVIEVSLEDAQILLDKLSEMLPVKYGAVFNIVQQFFTNKFKEGNDEKASSTSDDTGNISNPRS